MDVLAVLAIGLWALVVARLVAHRAVVSDRTVLVFVVLGGLMAAIVLPFVAVLIAPYGERGPWLNPLIVAGRLLILLLPIGAVAAAARAPATRVADAFLLAFAIGLGADLLTLLLGAAAGATPSAALSIVPPAVAAGRAGTTSGYAYAAALAALAYAAAFRFWTPRAALPVAGALVLGLAALEAGALGPRGAWTGGAALAWVTLAAAIAASWWEARATATAAPPSVLGRWLTAAMALTGTLSVRALRDWPWWRQLQAATWATLALGFVAAAALPATVSGWFWALPLVHAWLPPVTPLVVALAVAALWHYVAAAPAPEGGGVDDAVAFDGERAILRTAAAAALLVLAYDQAAALYPPPGLLAAAIGVPSPRLQAPQVVTLLALLAAAATVVALGRTARWLAAPLARRRAAVVRAVLDVAGAAVVVVACLLVYPRIVAGFHPVSGDVMFRWFGPRGNQVVALAMAAVMAVVAAAVALLVRAGAARIQRFMVDRPDGHERAAAG